MRIGLLLIPLLLITSILWAAEGIVAIVNNEVITAKDINDYLNFISFQLAAQYKGEDLKKKINNIKPDILERLIEDKLILQEAKRQSIQINELRVEEKLNQLKKEFNSQIEFQKALLIQGTTVADLEDKFRQQLLMYEVIDKEIKSKITIRPDEVTQFYQNSIQNFQEQESRRVTSIFIDNEKTLEEVMGVINEGGDFGELSKKYSRGSNFSGIVKRGQLRSEFEKSIFSLNLSSISSPIKTENGFYIFKLEEIILPRTLDLSEVKEEIYDYLFEEKFKTKMIEWLDGLKSKTYISIK